MNRINSFKVEEIIKEIKKIKPKSIYLYGSWLRCSHNSDSDIDVLVVVSNSNINYELLKKLTIKYPKVDLTVIREEELKNCAHGGFNRFYYFNIYYSSILVCGEDLISKLYTPMTTPRHALWRVQCIAQRLRRIRCNRTKEEEFNFWISKFKKWIKLCISEYLLIIEGIYTADLDEAVEIFQRKHWKISARGLEQLLETYEKLQNLFLKNMEEKNRVRNGVFIAVLNKDKKILMLERRDGLGWEFPKGGFKLNETFSECAKRELKEETGIKKIQAMFLTPIATSFKFPTEYMNQIRVYRGIIVHTNEQPSKLDPFFSNFKWMSFEEALIKMSWNSYKESLKKLKKWYECFNENFKGTGNYFKM